MARPVTRRDAPRIQVNVDHSPEQLGVYAPMDVQTSSAGAESLRQLMSAFQQLTPVVGQLKQQHDTAEFQQGQADEALGQTDKAHADRNRRYADGAYETATLQSYQDAERNTADFIASDEFDKSLPIDKQVELVDAHMKSQLENFLHDPRSRRIIGSRYGEFINKFASEAATNISAAHAQAAVEATTQDVMASLDRSGTFDWNESAQRLISQTGDPVKANETLIGIVTQRMEDAAAKGEPYEKLRDLIPTETVGPDGQKIPGPMYNPRYRAQVQQSEAKAKQLFDTFNRQTYAAGEFTARSELDAMVRDGVPITADTFKNPRYTIGDGPEFPVTPALAAAYIDASKTAQAKAAAKQATYDSFLAARQVFGSWRNTIGAPGGPDSEEKAKDAFAQWAQTTALGMGIPVDHMAGNGLLSDKAALTNFVNLAAQEGMTYQPLKETLANITQAAPGDIMARLQAYQLVKNKGVAPQYTDDQSALVYEAALGAKEAGVHDDQLQEYIRTLGDKTTHEQVSTAMAQYKGRKTGFEIVAEAGLIHDTKVNSNNTLSAAWLNGRAEELTTYAVSKDMPLEKAQAWAQERIRQSTVALPVGDSWMVVPKDTIADPKAASDALQWYQEQLPALGKKLNIPDDELTVNPVFALNGRGLRFEVRRQGVIPVSDSFTLDGLIASWHQAVPLSDPHAAAVAKDKAKRAADKQEADFLRNSRMPLQ